MGGMSDEVWVDGWTGVCKYNNVMYIHTTCVMEMGMGWGSAKVKRGKVKWGGGLEGSELVRIRSDSMYVWDGMGMGTSAGK